jgi:hypothetical protein
MLDEMHVLRAAIQSYRAAATAAGVAWPQRGDTQGAQPPDWDLIRRVSTSTTFPDS